MYITRILFSSCTQTIEGRYAGRYKVCDLDKTWILLYYNALMQHMDTHCSPHSSSNQASDIPRNDSSGKKACGLQCSRPHKHLLTHAPQPYLTFDDSNSTPEILLMPLMFRSPPSVRG